MKIDKYNFVLLFMIISLILLGFVLYDQGNKKVLCIDFKYQWQAQRAFDLNPVKYKGLDGDKDGLACEALPVR